MKVTYFDAFNRLRDLSSLNESVYDSKVPTKNFDLYFNRYKSTNDIDNLFKAIRECTNAIVANENVYSIIEVYNDLEDDTYDKKLVENKIINDVIPYTNKLNAKDFANTPFYEAIRITNVADRLNENHTMLKEKYGYDAYNKINETNRISYSNTCVMYEICSIIDTTNLPIQGKIITALEEYSLAMEKHHRPINENKAILAISTYFTAGESVDWNRIQNTLGNSIVLEFTNFTDDNGLCHIANTQDFEGVLQKCFDTSNSSYSAIEKYGIMTRSAVLGGNEEFASAIISKVPGEISKTILAKENIDKNTINAFISDSIYAAINENSYIIKLTDNNEIKKRLTHLNEAYNKTMNNLLETARIIDTSYNRYCIEGNLDLITGKLLTAKQMFDKGLSSAKSVANVVKNKVEPITSKIPKIKFEPKNVITLIMKADKAIADKFKKTKIAAMDKVNSLRSKVFSEGYIYDFIDENGRIDILLYTIEAENNTSEIYNFVETEITKYLNESVLKGTGYRTYYVCTEDQIDVHMTTDEFMIELTESDREEFEHYMSESMMEYLYDFANIEEDLANTHYATIQETIDFFTANPDKDIFKAYCELASIAGIDSDIIDEIGIYITAENTNITEDIERIVAEYEIDEEIPMFVQLEAIDMIADLIVEGEVPNFITTLDNPADKIKNKMRYKKYKLRKMKNKVKPVSFSAPVLSTNVSSTNEFTLLEVEYKDSKGNIVNKDANKKVIDKNKKVNDKNQDKSFGDKVKDGVKKVGNDIAAGAKKAKVAIGKSLKEINLNNLQLAINALRKSAKDMSAKEQELSRNADASFNYFIKSIKNLLVSDRREAIIKGSVIPSFSKCVKIGLGLITVGVVTMNPLIPAIILLGGVGISKELTKKERALLIDDIEIEIDVIDKQLQVYENNGQMKKYRAALKAKKELQRQQARIQYNIRIGKDWIPGSSGLTTRKNDE